MIGENSMELAVFLVAELLPLVPSMVKGAKGAVDAWNAGIQLMQTAQAEKRDLTNEELEAYRAMVHEVDDAIQRG